MCAQRKNSSSSSEELALDRPFDPAILKRAEEIAARYQIVIETDPDVGYFGHVREMPGVMGDGKTPNACVKLTREGAVVAVAYMLECGDEPPVPASSDERSEQVNLRLTPNEKYLMQEAARQQGFRGMSDFVRTTTLNAINQQQGRWAPPKKRTTKVRKQK
jgi:predicted RNase H-like HicB family nuclease